MPVLTVDPSKKKQIKSKFDKLNKFDSKVEAKIHSLDPSHESMPKYSYKYANEANHAAVRHLLGGGPQSGISVAPSAKDIRASNVHWQLGLRYY